MKKNIFILLVAFSQLAISQVGINTTTPNISSMLDVISTTKGVLIPRMLDTQKNAIATPATGLLIFQTNGTSGFYYYNGAAWSLLGSGSTETASNGLTKTVNDIQLGGNLTANTAVTQTAAQTLSFLNNSTANTIVNLQSTGDFVVQDNGTSAFQIQDNGTLGVGTANQFTINNTGNITRINNVVTSFPAAQGAANTFLRNDGVGNLTWVAGSSGWGLTGNAIAAGNFLGATNDLALEFRVNNQRAGYVGNSTNYNTFFGHQAGNSMSTGDGNTAMGKQALQGNTTGGANVAIGQGALLSSNGDYNIAVGISALQTNTSGVQNVAVGGTAGNGVTTGGYNAFFGTSATGSTATRTNAGAFGTNAIADTNNRIRIGSTTHTSIGGTVAYTNFSDERFKFNIKNNVKGIDFIKRLNPVTYQFDYDKLHRFYQRSNKNIPNLPFASKGTQMIQSGFMAQEIEALCKEMNFDFGAVDKPDNTEEGIYGIRYSTFVVPLVKAVQEQQVLIETQNQKIDQLQEELKELKQLVLSLKKE